MSVVSLVERLAKKRAERDAALRAYYEALAYRRGGNSWEALDALTKLVLDVGHLEDATGARRDPLGVKDVRCEAQAPLAPCEPVRVRACARPR